MECEEAVRKQDCRDTTRHSRRQLSIATKRPYAAIRRCEHPFTRRHQLGFHHSHHSLAPYAVVAPLITSQQPESSSTAQANIGRSPATFQPQPLALTRCAIKSLRAIAAPTLTRPSALQAHFAVASRLAFTPWHLAGRECGLQLSTLKPHFDVANAPPAELGPSLS